MLAAIDFDNELVRESRQKSAMYFPIGTCRWNL